MNYVERIVARQQKEYHSQLYVNFRKEAEISKLTKNELLETVDDLIEKDYTFRKHTTIREKIIPKSYSLTYNDRLIMLSYYDGHKHCFCTTNYHDDKKNEETPNSFKEFKKLFVKRTGLTMLKAFGRTTQTFKRCCPNPLYYLNRGYELAVWYKDVTKEDYTSHYPSSALGSLPDATTALEVEGEANPTPEYKFAFYPDSGNIAIYGELDSREWIEHVDIYSSKTKRDKFVPNYRKPNSRTILMKEAKYDLKEEVMHYYNIKSNTPKDSQAYHNAKIFLLKFIGMLEQCSPMIYKSYPFAHLASVIKWRSNIKMFKTIEQIGRRNVIQICVDGIIHLGKPIGSTVKDIGVLNIEFVNAKFVHRGINQYILKDSTKEERKHAGLDVNVSSNEIMNWMASPKVDFLTYMKQNYLIEEKL